MIVDLTHTLRQDMIVFPGTPEVKIQQISSIAFDGYNEKLLTIATHTGTHIDAPNHIVPDTKTLDQLPPEQFVGRACVIDCHGLKKIDQQIISKHSELITKSDFVLFYTGWEHLWNKNEYLRGFPVLTPDAASLLVKHRLKGIGMDIISVDPIDSHDLPIHHILLSKGLVIIENLTNLSLLPTNTLFNFMVLPIKLKDADGAPVRAIAIL